MLLTKKIVLLLLFFTGILTAEEQPELNKLPEKEGTHAEADYIGKTDNVSTFTSLLISKLNQKENLTDSMIENFGIREIKDEYFVNSFVILEEGLSFHSYQEYGIIEGSEFGRIKTAHIPVKSLESFSNENGVIYVEIGQQASNKMDEAKSSTWTDWVQDGFNLPNGYSGEDVIIGVVDIGFDYTHTNFYNEAYDEYRIKRVWEQKESGFTSPSNYNYGSEFNNEADILNKGTDISEESHGTHVAGIAGGRGGEPDNKYKGVAPSSELVFVGTSMKSVDILEGIEYITQYAEEQNKPVVINVSIGHQLGPHDGTSLFDQGVDYLVDEGKLIVGAAGNSGSEQLYIEHDFNSLSDSVMFTFLEFPKSSNGNDGVGVIDIWGEPGEEFVVSVNLYNTDNNSYEDWTPYISSSSGGSYSYTLEDNAWWWTENTYINKEVGINPLNNKPRMTISVDNSDQSDNFRWVFLEVSGTNGKTQIWGGPTGGEIEFIDNDNNYPIIEGTTNSTIGEIGGTSKSIISVGGYTSKNSYTNFSGNTQSIPAYAPLGEIAPFSSKGPTADGRTKPDITAPGNVVISSVNSYDQTYSSNSYKVVSGVTNNSNNWWYASMHGTSMSAPVVTGIIALMMEEYPELNYNQAVGILRENAWTDSYTGSISQDGSNMWGWGKVDAHESMLALLSNIPETPKINPSEPVILCEGESEVLEVVSDYDSYEWFYGDNSRQITVSEYDSHAVRVVNDQGYKSPWSDWVKVSVYSHPEKPEISVADEHLISDEAFNHQWFYEGEKIIGANENKYLPQEEGVYYLKVFNEQGCSNKSEKVSVNLPGRPEITINEEPPFCKGEEVIISGPDGFSDYEWSNGQKSSSIQTTTSGDYTLRVFNEEGFASEWSSPKEVVFHEKPLTPQIDVAGDKLISSSGNNNQWYFEGVKIGGATDSVYQAHESGNYHVEVVNEHGCVSTSEKTYISLASMKTARDESTIAIFPNPNEGVFSIKFLKNIENFKVKIFDISGSLMYNNNYENITTNEKDIDVENLEPGVYNINIKTPKNVIDQRLIIKN